MPVYKVRTIHDYPIEFYRCPGNPNGLEFICFFCGIIYENKSSSITHMKKCDTDYNDAYEFEGGITVHDFHCNHAAESKTVKTYILTNELSGLSNLSSSEIMDKIEVRLLENGFIHDSFYLKNTAYLIYKFFFEVVAEETNAYLSRIKEHLR
jgi:hypothetical protein